MCFSQWVAETDGVWSYLKSRFNHNKKPIKQSFFCNDDTSMSPHWPTGSIKSANKTNRSLYFLILPYSDPMQMRINHLLKSCNKILDGEYDWKVSRPYFAFSLFYGITWRRLISLDEWKNLRMIGYIHISIFMPIYQTVVLIMMKVDLCIA